MDTCRLGSCRLCHQKHNTLLHKHNENICKDATYPNIVASHNPESVLRGTLSVQSSGQVLLGTALVKVTNPKNKNTYVARALLDASSQTSS